MFSSNANNSTHSTPGLGSTTGLSVGAGFHDSNGGWVLEETLDGHSDWVRDVAWAPNVGLPRSYVASCGQDRRVIVWTKDGEGKPWEKQELNAGSLEGNAGSEGKYFLSCVVRWEGEGLTGI